MVILVMGVSGSGKTTVGTLLARDLGWEFFDGDDFHPAANVAKMRRGEPLTDADRDGWLDTLSELIGDLFREGRSAVLACSALRAGYRSRLRASRASEVALVHLRGDPTLIRARLAERQGHFMKADLLASQLASLEEPSDALVVDAAESPVAIVERIRAGLALGR